MLHHRLSCGADKGEPGYPDPEIKGEGVVSKFFFSALWASVCSKIKGGGGTGPLGPFTESATSINTLMSVVGEVCKDKKKFFKKQKTKKKINTQTTTKKTNNKEQQQQ